MSDEWGPTDDEVDDWLAEWEAVDREAARYLTEHLPELLDSSDPGPPREQALADLRAGVAEMRPPYDYFARALEWSQEIPADDDVWLDALAASLEPFDDPEIDIESQSAVMALQHADWLGLVLGLVRRGVGATLDPELAQQDIDNLDDMDGQVEDREGHLDVLSMALLTLTPLWRALRVLDEDDRLTELGRWGLPRALHLVWADPVADLTKEVPRPIEADTERAALSIIAREQPITLEDLRKRLAAERMIVDAERLRVSMLSHEDVFEFADQTIGHLPTLTKDLVLTHVVTERELELSALEDGVDLHAWTWVLDEEQPLAGGGTIQVRHALSGLPMPGEAGAAIVGPNGWLDEFSAGDVIALRRSHDGFVVEEATYPEGYDADETYTEDLVELIRSARAAVEFDAEYGDPTYPGASGSEIVFRTRLARPRSFTRPMPPIRPLLDAFGFEVVGGYVGLPGTPWHGEPEWFDDEQREAWRDWTTTLSALAGSGEPPAPEALVALAASLRGAELVSFAAQDVDHDDETVARLADAMSAATSGRDAVVPLYLQARLAEAHGDGPAWVDLLERAVAADSSLEDAVAELADLRSVAGDAREARRLYQLARVDGLANEVQVLQPFLDPPAGPGRNKPCPCGSGKKYKVCHGRTDRHPLPDRANWLWWKLAWFAQRPKQRPVMLEWGERLAGADDREHAAEMRALSDPTTLDFAVFGSGLLRRFLEVLGELLPEDERDLATRWLESDLRLMEVVATSAQGIDVRDLLTDEELHIADRTLPKSLSAKDLLYARPLDDGSGTLRFRTDPLGLPRLMRSPLLARLRSGASLEEIAQLLAPQSPPELRTSHGEEFVLCTARYDAGDIDKLWTGLTETMQAESDTTLTLLDPDRTVLGTIEREGERVVVTTNSVERLRRLQSMLREADPEAKLIVESTRPPDFSDLAAKDRPAAEAGPPAPELSEDDVEGIRRHFEERWLADSIPALGGRTPREAAESPEGRRELAALLDDFEWTDRQSPSPAGMDVDRLRRELGLA